MAGGAARARAGAGRSSAEPRGARSHAAADPNDAVSAADARRSTTGAEVAQRVRDLLRTTIPPGARRAVEPLTRVDSLTLARFLAARGAAEPDSLCREIACAMLFAGC